MDKIELYTEMKNQLAKKELLEQAKDYAYDYIDNLQVMDVFPTDSSILDMKNFEEPMPESPCPPGEVLGLINRYGTKNTVAQTGGKYFGFVCGGSLGCRFGRGFILRGEQSAAHK
jgi:hypothetical protein